MMPPDQDVLDGDPALQRRWQKIEAKLRAAKSHLVTAGCVVKRRLPGYPTVWVVRYRERSEGRCRHRSIYLGPQEFARKAWKLIQCWRTEAVSPEDRRRRELLGLLGLTAGARNYSRRARKRLGSAAERAFGDHRAELQLVYGMGDDDQEIRWGKPPGRPAKSGLW